MEKSQCIAKLREGAQLSQKKINVLSSLTLAQAILESGWLESQLCKTANNIFGVKGQGNAGSVKMKTTEYEEGSNIPYTIEAEFRKYITFADSIEDHTHLFTYPRYRNLINEPCYEVACANVEADGYATDDNYSEMLIRIIQQNRLYIYDLLLETDGLIKKGEKSFRVKVLQTLLNGYNYNLEVDGAFGDITRGAVRDFQTSNNISIDGIVGKQTISKL